MTNVTLLNYIRQHDQDAEIIDGKLMINDSWYKDGVKHDNWVEISPSVRGIKDWLGY